jgi:AAA domain
MYDSLNEGTSANAYNFTKDFDDIALPGLDRSLAVFTARHGDAVDDDRRAEFAETYRNSLWRALSGRQTDSRIIEDDWNAECAAAIAAQFEADAIHDEMGGDEAESPPCDPVPPDDPVMAAAAELARAQVTDEAWTAHSESALQATGQRLQDMRNRGLEDNAELVSRWMLSQLRLDRMRAESEARRQAAGGAKQEYGNTPEPMFQRAGLIVPKPREWLVKGFIPENEAINPFGRPDSFKGVSMAQVTVHIAGGVPFLGRAVKQGPTIYFAAERLSQAHRRILGHIERLELPSDLPCFVGGRPINLLDPADVRFLLSEVRAAGRDAGAPVRLITIDTQARTLPGDENSTKDGSAYANAIEHIRQEHPCATIAAIAHTGHSEEAQDRPRGSSALLGGYETFYRFKKKDERSGSVKVTLDRDGLGGLELPFVVDLYETSMRNSEGEPVFVPWIELDESPAEAAPRDFVFKKPGDTAKPTKTTELQQEALRALRKAIQDHGKVTPEGEGLSCGDVEGIPRGEATVELDAWKVTFVKLDHERSPDACRKRLPARPQNWSKGALWVSGVRAVGRNRPRTASEKNN